MDPKHAKIRAEFIKEIDSNLTDEEKALRDDVKTNEYIDIFQYVEWLEKKLIISREEINTYKLLQ